jgi:hypothetical protein
VNLIVRPLVRKAVDGPRTAERFIGEWRTSAIGAQLWEDAISTTEELQW